MSELLMQKPYSLSDLSGRRMIVSEEALKTGVGHFYEYNRSVVDIAAQYGVESIVAVHRNANAAVCGDLPAHPVYAETSWGTINTERNALKRHAGTVLHNLRVYATMTRLLDKVGPVDTLFAPTVTIHHIPGFRLLAARRLGRDVRRMVLLTRNTIASYLPGSEVPRFKRQAEVLARIIRSFDRHYDTDTFTFATDSERLANEYQALCGVRPVVFTSPRIAPLQIASTRDTATVTFTSLGPARFEKGIDILERTIARLIARPEGLDASRFVIQWNQDLLGPNGDIVSPDSTLFSHPSVRYITGEMASVEYNSELYSADCIVLPYRVDSYYARISGVAVEAVTAGLPLIYTKGTWCEEFVKSSGSGIGVPDGDDTALAEAIIKMTREVAAYRAEAQAAAMRVRAENSSEAFAKRLFGIAERT